MADGDERGRGGSERDTVAALVQLAVAPVVGRIVRMDAAGPWVDFPGNPGGPVLARTTIPLEREVVAAASAESRGVLLVFEQSWLDRPIVVGLLQAPDAEPATARVDGKRVVLEGKDEVELRCGAASITLRRNGRIVIRGVEVETRARGRNRIRGGSVQIN